MPVKYTTEMPSTEQFAHLKSVKAEAEHAHKVITSFFASPSALEQHESMLTHEFYAYYDKFRNHVEFISKTQKKWVIKCSVEAIDNCYRAAYILEHNIPINLTPNEKYRAEAARFLRCWVSECERNLGK